MECNGMQVITCMKGKVNEKIKNKIKVVETEFRSMIISKNLSILLVISNGETGKISSDE